MRISIMITTHNRLSDLQRTLAVLKQLDPPPWEILITADGCDDGTIDFVRQEMPQARLMIHPEARGSVASRDRMMREATGDLVFSLDDDSYPEQLDCLPRVTAQFAERPLLAVALFPQRSDEYPPSLTKAEFGKPAFTRSFPNSGAVFRRSIYLQLPGFEPRFFHAYEEPDYALQCVGHGFEVYYTPVLTIRHHYSGQGRNRNRIHRRHARTSIWSALLRCPFPFVIGLIAHRITSHFRYACSQGAGWIVREPIWWCGVAPGIAYCLRRRQPLPWSAYQRWLNLPDSPTC